MASISSTATWRSIFVAISVGAGLTLGCDGRGEPAQISRDAGRDDRSPPDSQAAPDAGGDAATTAAFWAATGALQAGRSLHTATRLEDGRVLVTGGKSIEGKAMSSSEVYDPVAGAWLKAAPMSRARAYHAATLLGDGAVLVAGGWDGSPLSSAERFDPSTLTWSKTAPMASPRYGHTASLIEDSRGKVLVAAGAFLTSAEIYDDQASRWETTGPMMTARGFHTATLLDDGSILVAAGQESSTAVLQGAELFLR